MRLGLVCVGLVLGVWARAQTPATSVEGLVSWHGNVSLTLTHRVGSFHDVLGVRGFDIAVRPFAGVNLGAGSSPTFGGVLAWERRLPLAKEAFANVGVFGQWTQPWSNRTFDGGIYVGVTLYLGD